MSNFQKMDITTLASSNKNINKTINIKSITTSVILFLVSLVIIYLLSYFSDKSSAIYMFLFTASIVLIIFSAVRLLTKRTRYVYTPTGSLIEKHHCYFKDIDSAILLQTIDTLNISKLSTFSKQANGNVRLDYFVSQDLNFIAIQLFQYVPYTFEPVSEIKSFTDKDSKIVAGVLLP